MSMSTSGVDHLLQYLGRNFIGAVINGSKMCPSLYTLAIGATRWSDVRIGADDWFDSGYLHLHVYRVNCTLTQIAEDVYRVDYSLTLIDKGTPDDALELDEYPRWNHWLA